MSKRTNVKAVTTSAVVDPVVGGVADEVEGGSLVGFIAGELHEEVVLSRTANKRYVIGRYSLLLSSCIFLTVQSPLSMILLFIFRGAKAVKRHSRSRMKVLRKTTSETYPYTRTKYQENGKNKNIFTSLNHSKSNISLWKMKAAPLSFNILINININNNFCLWENKVFCISVVERKPLFNNCKICV